MDKSPYQQKRRPLLEGFIEVLAIAGLAAFTAGYIYWAVSGSKYQKQPSQIERAVEAYSTGQKELSDKLNIL